MTVSVISLRNLPRDAAREVRLALCVIAIAVGLGITSGIVSQVTGFEIVKRIAKTGEMSSYGYRSTNKK